MTFLNVIILIKSIVNMNKNIYYYSIFLEKTLLKVKSDTQYFLMNVCILQMPYFDRINFPERTDVNKTSASRM